MLTRAAIDFGITNTDAVAETGQSRRVWTRATQGEPTPDLVADILAEGGLKLQDLRRLAVTGGRHRHLPPWIGECEIVAVGEIPAIGCGGQTAAIEAGLNAEDRLLVVSAGSGTAAVFAHGDLYQHVSGSGVGGGTLLGLSRLLLHTVNPAEIDALALSGDPNGADLALADVISGPIGSLPPDATAVNFGRVGKYAISVSRADIAAALVTLVGQVIGVTALNSARARQAEHIIVTGHLLDMPSLRRALERVGEFYGTTLTLAANPGYATALGALRYIG